MTTTASDPALAATSLPTRALPNLQPLPPMIADLADGIEFHDPMEAPAIRWGILGAGLIARRFAADVAAHTRSEVVAVAARDADRAATFAAENGIARSYGSYEQLLADGGIDAVYVATVNPMHRSQAEAVLRSGKPVLVEKPFTMNAREADEVFAIAREQGVFAMEAMWSRFLPQHTVLRQIVRGGKLGAAVTAHANFAGTMLGEDIPRLVRPELGGGALLDIGVYSVAVVHEALGKADEVVAAGHLMKDHAVDRSASVVMKTAEGLGTARCSLDGRAEIAAEIVFEWGIVELPYDFHVPGKIRVHTFADGGPTEESADGLDGAITEEWDGTVPGGFQFEAAEVARCIAGGQLESDVMPWSATVEILDVLDQARTAIGVRYPGE